MQTKVKIGIGLAVVALIAGAVYMSENGIFQGNAAKGIAVEVCIKAKAACDKGDSRMCAAYKKLEKKCNEAMRIKKERDDLAARRGSAVNNASEQRPVTAPAPAPQPAAAPVNGRLVVEVAPNTPTTTILNEGGESTFAKYRLSAIGAPVKILRLRVAFDVNEGSVTDSLDQVRLLVEEEDRYTTEYPERVPELSGAAIYFYNERDPGLVTIPAGEFRTIAVRGRVKAEARVGQQITAKLAVNFADNVGDFEANTGAGSFGDGAIMDGPGYAGDPNRMPPILWRSPVVVLSPVSDACPRGCKLAYYLKGNLMNIAQDLSAVEAAPAPAGALNITSRVSALPLARININGNVEDAAYHAGSFYFDAITNPMQLRLLNFRVSDNVASVYFVTATYRDGRQIAEGPEFGPLIPDPVSGVVSIYSEDAETGLAGTIPGGGYAMVSAYAVLEDDAAGQVIGVSLFADPASPGSEFAFKDMTLNQMVYENTIGLEVAAGRLPMIGFPREEGQFDRVQSPTGPWELSVRRQTNAQRAPGSGLRDDYATSSRAR